MEIKEVDSFRQTNFDILVESKLEEMEFHDPLYTDVGKFFNRKNLKNMLMIKDVVKPVGIDMEFLFSKRAEIDDFPLFTK